MSNCSQVVSRSPNTKPVRFKGRVATGRGRLGDWGIQQRPLFSRSCPNSQPQLIVIATGSAWAHQVPPEPGLAVSLLLSGVRNRVIFTSKSLLQHQENGGKCQNYVGFIFSNSREPGADGRSSKPAPPPPTAYRYRSVFKYLTLDYIFIT